MSAPILNAADVAVVGLGAYGSAIACALARRGARVVGIDRFHPPHVQGSSHGRTRITRLAVGEGADYVPLVQRSHVLWRELEAQTGLSLMRETGLLVLASPAADAGAFHGQADFFGSTRELALRFGIPHELLDAAAVRERFPAFVPQDGDVAYHEPGGGVLFPEACIRALWQCAVGHGAQLRGGERLLEITSSSGGVTLHTDRGTLHAAQAVLCTGAWLPAQVGATLQRRLQVLPQVLHWFAADRPQAWDPARCPAFIWLHGPTAEDAFYGFPMVDDVAGVKVATEQLRDVADPDAQHSTADAEFDAQAGAALFEQRLRGRLAGLRAQTVMSARCLYTMAPGGRFIVDRHPQHERVTVVSACSGHGFKHAAGLGERIARSLLGEIGPEALSAFAMPR